MHEKLTPQFLKRMPKNISVVYLENDEEATEPYIFEKDNRNDWFDSIHGICFSNVGLADFINEYIDESDRNEYYPNVLFADGKGKSWDYSEVRAQLGDREMMGRNVRMNRRIGDNFNDLI